ncbi:MAG TPA: acyl-CoA dehydrogenase, partial [Geobacterales bacterium]|nr:acyl-CoA dehydrogenase [Geobacterales bacterium]
MTLISLSLLLLLLVLLAWFRPPLLLAAILLMLHLATSAFFLQGPWLIIFPVLLTITLLILVVPLRRQLLTRPIFSLFRRLLPPMSATEREALEAGTVWWDKEFFSGRPNWRRMLAEPAATLSPEEQAFVDGPVEELCGLLNDWEIVHDLHDLPPEAWRVLKEKGFFGMIIPKEYGGLGFSALAHSTVIMKLASRSVTAAVTAMVPNSLGPAELLLHYGTQEQKNHYLPRLARGIEVPCFALTGPDAGSDAASIPDFGILCRGSFEGKELIGIRLTFEKRYITLAPVATVIGLAFQLRDPDHLLGAVEELGITCALVPATLPGITIGSRHDPLGVPFQNGPIWGKEVFIPVDFIIGGVSGAGQGWKMLMESLAAGRGISLPALSTGAGKLVSRGVGGHARIRKQFNLPIGRFEGVEEALARIAGSSYLLDAARIVTCGAIDQGMKPSVISAIVKYHSTERMRQIVNDGMDVSGGNGICLGPRNYLGHPYQSAPIGITV